MALSNKSPAIARINRDQAFNWLKTTGPNAFINRQRSYLESLKNPQFTSPPINFTAQPYQPSPGSFEKVQSSSSSFQISPSFWNRLSRITRLALIGGSTVIIVSVLIIAFVILPMLTQQSPSPAKANPAVTQPAATQGISLADEIAAQPCLVGQIKGSQSKIYHLPGQKFYAETKDNVTCFTSEAEAQNAGFRKA